MAEQDRAGEADRFAHGTGRTERHEAEQDGFRPGETGGGQTAVPGTAQASAQGADRAEGTEGAVGEMDFTGAPAGPGGSSGPSGGSATAASQGGGPQGGSTSSGGTGPGVAGAGPQSIEATTAALGDMEPSAGSGGASRTDDDRDA
ncbi:MAG TPA: hypothetical protein VN282_25055 [Pyrinomonadaceae bacterium]|nr:hypothetical protein [Pyrinomonadaceae bacterium]